VSKAVEELFLNNCVLGWLTSQLASELSDPAGLVPEAEIYLLICLPDNGH